jgi:hypothetical protein
MQGETNGAFIFSNTQSALTPLFTLQSFESIDPSLSFSGPGKQMQKFMKAMQSSGQANSNSGYQTWCSSRIQAWYRHLRPKWEYTILRHSMYHIAAVQIQYTWRNFCQHKYMNMNKPKPEHLAAAAIQRSWRRYTNLRIYRYYKDLIAFRNAGDPTLMLKAINPLEAGLVDPAFGAHIRFRLGGHLFPPSIYYKIFTHNALCDVGAFAPRDYTINRATPSTHDLHNKNKQQHNIAKTSIRVGGAFFGTKGFSDDDQEGWYRRIENNGWRPVTVKVLQEAEDDPVAKETANREQKFHWSRQKRRQDIETKRKMQKRNWMQKMYKEGLEEGKQAERKQSEGNDADLDDELDDDELLKVGLIHTAVGYTCSTEHRPHLYSLQWTNDLDFDEYVDNWQVMATSSSVPKGNEDPSW